MSATQHTASSDDTFLGPGELAFTREPTTLRTILGSCVAVCLHDPVLRAGGMCHFILPTPSVASPGSMPAHAFGDEAIASLIARFAEAGRSPRQLTAKVIGGGHVMGSIASDIGSRNIDIARTLLARHAIPITGESVGGSAGRRVQFQVGEGRVFVSAISQSALPESLVLIGASTGGTEALARILSRLRRPMPPIVITQHIPPGFSETLAANLQRLTDLRLVVPRGGEELAAHHVYLAPGGRHLTLFDHGENIVTRLDDTAPVHSCKPSVDIMLHSAARLRSRTIVAAILTGMGVDGADGLRALKNRGAYTLAQNQESCVVYGMPRAAKESGAVDREVPLDDIPTMLVKFSQMR